jgi:hypothetical protein
MNKEAREKLDIALRPIGMPASTAYALLAFKNERKANWLWFGCGVFIGLAAATLFATMIIRFG